MSNYAIASTSIIPLRQSPSDRSEMVSQILFGELVEIIDQSKGWLNVVTETDSYQGWIDSKQVTKISEDEFFRLKNGEVFYSKEILTTIYDLDLKQELRIVFGSHLVGFSNGKVHLTNKAYIVRESPINLKTNTSKESLLNYARLFLGAPYLWGGKTPFGVDCSGLIQNLFKVVGIMLPRDAHQQALVGNVVDFVEDSQEGDLAFFENENGQIIHVGLVLRNNKILHASGNVKIDLLDHNGIYNSSINDYTHKLRFIKRIF